VDNTFWRSFAAGAVSGTVSSILLQPLDMIKTRQQTVTRLSLTRHASLILRNEGALAFWKGLVPTLARTVPGVGLYFSTLGSLQKHLLGSATPSPIQSVALGGSARCAAGVLLLPITVIKTRFESGLFSYTGLFSAIGQLCRHEGVRGMTSGLVPTLLRDAPFSGLYLMFYTQLKTMAKSWDAGSSSKSQQSTKYTVRSTKNNTPNVNQDEEGWGRAGARSFLCGLVAGALACLVTHPFDVVKTKVQTSKDGLKAGEVISTILEREGMKGFAVGLSPRLLRRTLMAALSWSIFEHFTKTIKSC